MSDKGFGDHLNRNIVKNPLLSTAVTGLSIEDLTHRAVLLPAAPSQVLSTRNDQQTGPQVATLANADRKNENFPSGDANSNISHTNFPPTNNPNVHHASKNDPNQKTTVSKALPKSDDDFDVNEYFARLHGTRYVSAPLNSLIKDDQKTNLEATEDNLEEINLNEPEKVQNVEVQQSLTADIAQNFSQLPTVLPQVASAVFSSFSSMLNMKSREVTPDAPSAKPSEYQEVQFRPEDVGVPLMGVDEPSAPKEVAPPPREMSVGGTSNYRITTKKKAYAQIPGLSSTNTAPMNPPKDSAPFNYTLESTINFAPQQTNNDRSENIANLLPPLTHINITNASDITLDADLKSKPLQMNIEKQHISNPSNPKEYNLFTPSAVTDNTQVVNTEATHKEYNIFTPTTAEFNPPKGVETNLFGKKPSNLFSTVEQNLEQQTHNATNASIIPPPPMFSNVPRNESQANVKSFLPPSVARRIGTNHPIIKPQTLPPILVSSDNIFVPTPLTDEEPQTTDLELRNTSLPKETISQTIKTDILPPPTGSAFVQFNAPSPKTEKNIPQQTSESITASNSFAHVLLATNPSSVKMIPSSLSKPDVSLESSLANQWASTPSAFPPASIPKSDTVEGLKQTSESIPARSSFAHVSLSTNPSSVNMLPSSLFEPNVSLESSLANQTPSAFPPASIPKSETVAPPMFFNPSTLLAPTLPPLDAVSTSQSFADKMVPTNIARMPPPPTFFDPSSIAQISEPQASQYNIPLQSFEQTPPESTKPVHEPPKLSGSLSYRMLKKRPQYYSGPIEGVGAISNNLKPTIPTQELSTFQGSLFTPKTIEPAKEQPVLNINPPVIPQPTISSTPYPHFELNTTQGQHYVESDYNTAFDMSRQTTDNYEPPKEEGFGIIGSLKSKLSSLDINKIQNTVTTFFDPAYNASKKEETNTSGSCNNPNFPYGYNRNEESTFDVFVANLDQTNPAYSQNYGQCNQHPYSYGKNNKYYHNQTYDYGSQVQTNATPSLYTGFGQNSLSPDNYGVSSANSHVSTDYGNLQVTQAEIDSLIQTSEADSIISSILAQESDETISGSSRHGVIGSTEKFSKLWGKQIFAAVERPFTTPSDSSENREIASLFSYENKVGNQNKEVRQNELTETAFFDDQPFDLSLAVHTEDLNKKLKKLHIAQEKEADLLMETKMLPDNVVSEIFSNEPDSTPLDYPQTTVTGHFFTNFPLPGSQSAGYLDNYYESNDADGYGSSYFQNGNNYKETLKKEEIQDNIPYIDPTTTPLFGLPNILADVSIAKPISDFEGQTKSASLFGAVKEAKDEIKIKGEELTQSTTDKSQQISNNNDTSDLNICKTHRKENTLKDKETDNLTSQLIENITAPFQLSNSVIAPLTESATAVIDSSFEPNQCAEISQITEDTIETILVQSATEILDDENGVRNCNILNYGWSATGDAPFNPPEVLLEHDYNFQIDPNNIGFFSNNSLFLEDIPKNASDELKAEFKNSHEDTPLFVPRQMSIPTAPPAEDDDTKSDETGGLDVHSIEQDAKKDFPIYEEFVIEPSETDDDKIEYKEREKSSDDPAQDVDTFTNRVERFKMMEEDKCDDVFSIQKSQLFDMNIATSPAITIASYFDTGNYAAETHYRNSISSPPAPFNIGSTNDPMRIPPGFEEEYKRRMSELSARNYDNKSDKNDNKPYIPDTSTQTRTVTTTTYSMVENKPLDVTVTSNMVVSAMAQEIPHPAIINLQTSVAESTLKEQTPVITELPELSSVFGQKLESGDNLASSLFTKIDKEPVVPAFKADERIETAKAQPLADPISFFSSKDDTLKETTDNNVNRLASYFTSPAKTDHGKSFFELSQSQNHYRHAGTGTGDTKNLLSSFAKEDISKADPKINIENIPTDVYLANLTLINDLTASRNLTVSPKDQIKTVNYFTVEYENDTELKNAVNIGEPDLNKVDRENLNKYDELEECVMCDDTKIMMVVSKCKYCCNNDFFQRIITLNKVAIDTDFNVRKVNDPNNTDNRTDKKPDMDQRTEDRKTEVTVTFGNLIQEESEGVSTTTESRASTEYCPVKHHWFYRVDFEGKSIWRGFSASDNRALEDAFASPDLDELTVVATDGGRFDVNIIGRLRTAVYWSDKPTNVRRCSWFYKGTTDARYVPYTEPVAEKLEEEYRRGVTTGEWHRRLVLPSNELVVMHGPAVMVHFPHAPDAIGTSPLFAFSKRVYRNPPKIRVAQDTPARADHLILLVHGAGEYRNQKEKEKFQSTMRPRVVRRGCDESEIEDPEPSSIDHLLLLCHGVGSACDMRFRSVEEVVDDFRATSLQLIQSHYRNSYEKGVVNRVEVLPISWHATLHSGETGVDRRLAAITLDSIPRLRNFTNDTVLDVLFYTSPVFCQTIIDTVCAELNRIYALFASRNPGFSGRVSLGGHSLGSVILYDLLCHQSQESAKDAPSVKSFVEGGAGTGQAAVRYPPLAFRPAAMYALGSPIAMFECIRGVKSLGENFSLPTCKKFFNIFHPYDPIAYRIEPLINSQLGSVKPFLIPHHKGRKRMHLELKDTMARVGADLKQKLIESLKSTWSSMWKSQGPPHDAHLEKVVEEEIEKEQLCDETKEETTHNDIASPEMLGKLNGGRRVDYVLQETPFEMINEYLFAMSSHVCYWESEDTMLLILREIYDALGVQPDCTVPQQSMTVHRTRPATNEANVVTTSEYPSTSRDGT